VPKNSRKAAVFEALRILSLNKDLSGLICVLKIADLEGSPRSVIITMPVAATLNFISALPRRIRGRIAISSAHAGGTHQHFDAQKRIKHSTLADLSRGESAVIASISGSTSSKLHLMEMGLTPGTSVRVVRVAVFGGPMDITVRGYRLSLRREEAQAIQLR
jgi:ferrous iron transport protein A